MYSSPLAVAAREAKKLCSKIKSQVSNFEKLVTSWNHNCSEVSQLLHQLNKNCDSMESITKCSRSPHMSSLFAMFPDLNEKLIGNIIVENEDICIQLKVFMRILRDVNTAMQLQAYECSGIISSFSTVDTVFGTGDDSVTLAVEDVLDLQQKYYHYNQRLIHMETMIKDLMNKNNPCIKSVDDYWLKKSDVVEVIRSW